MTALHMFICRQFDLLTAFLNNNAVASHLLKYNADRQLFLPEAGDIDAPARNQK